MNGARREATVGEVWRDYQPHTEKLIRVLSVR
jgi:hypothetical protein